MSLMKSLHGKQVLGIVLVVVLLLVVFVYGVRGYRNSDRYAASQSTEVAPNDVTNSDVALQDEQYDIVEDNVTVR